MSRIVRKVEGLAVIEFSIVSVVLFLLVLGILSIGAFMFSLQAVNESTRQAARLASVCQISSSGNISQKVASKSLISGLSQNDIVIEYLDEDGTVLATPTIDSVAFVRARATHVTFQFISLLGFLGENGLITMPSFETTIPSESLGIVPDDMDTNC